MNWVTVIWSMIASACLTMAATHLLVWCRDRKAWASLIFAGTAISTAGAAACELAMMHAMTVAQFGTALRCMHLPILLVFVGLVGFVLLHLHAGRPWLGWLACGLRVLSTSLNFVFSPNLNYRQITGLRQVPFFGESVSVADGVPNPWMLIGQLSLLLLIVFLVDATITVWRRGERRQALLLGGAIIFFTSVSTLQVIFSLWGFAHLPLTPSLLFLGVVAAMSVELSEAMLRATRLSEEVRETQARMALAAEAAGVGIWIWDVARDEIWGTERWMGMFGIQSGTPVSVQTMLARIHPDDRGTVERDIRRAIAERADYAGEYRVVLPDGSQRWLSALGRLHRESGASVGRMLGATIDNTAHRQSELRIEQQRSELAHLSRVTTLGELSGSLAHELNQPLTAILSNAQAAQRFLATENADLAEVREILADIASEDIRAGEIIRRLRLLLRKGEVQHQPLQVNEVVREVLNLVRNDLVNRGVTAQQDLAPDLPEVCGDRVELQQVMLNLIINACDAMADVAARTREVRVATAREGSSVHISVTDRGCGIAPDKLQEVFAPFYTTKKDGMGLGLAVCRTIISAHGGELWAASEPGQGATFHVVLPVAEAHHSEVRRGRA